MVFARGLAERQADPSRMKLEVGPSWPGVEGEGAQSSKSGRQMARSRRGVGIRGMTDMDDIHRVSWEYYSMIGKVPGLDMTDLNVYNSGQWTTRVALTFAATRRIHR